MNVTKHMTPAAGEVVGIELSCEDFDGEFSFRYSNACSLGCADGMRMFFTPKLHGSTIHANICAGRWEFVNKLSKEWWARKAAPILGWDESKIREQTDPVWAAKVHGANNRVSYQNKPRRSGAACLMCSKPVDKGVDICVACVAENEHKPKVDSGSTDELDNWD